MGKIQRYEDAVNRYNSAMNKYTGEQSWQLKSEMAREYSQKVADQARSDSLKALRSTGQGKAAAANLANESANKAAQQGWQQGFEQAHNHANQTLQSNQVGAQLESDLSKTRHDQTTSNVAGVAGTIGSLFSAAGGMASDERLKNIKMDLDSWH